MKKVLLALSLVALTNVAFAQATPIKVDVTFSDVFTYANSCSGESVDFTYTIEFSMRGTVNGNRVNTSIHQSEQYDGVGQTSGNTYHGNSQIKQTENYSLNNGQLIFDFVAHTMVTTPGGSNNLKISQTFHVTVNANGDVSVLRGDATTFECQ
jgi:hypothetical protein